MDFPRPYLKVYEDAGVNWDLKIDPVPLHSLLFNSAEKCPEKTAIIFFGMKISYAMLAACVRRAASAFHERGLRKGERVAIMLPIGV